MGGVTNSLSDRLGHRTPLSAVAAALGVPSHTMTRARQSSFETPFFCPFICLLPFVCLLIVLTRSPTRD